MTADDRRPVTPAVVPPMPADIQAKVAQLLVKPILRIREEDAARRAGSRSAS